MTDNLVASSFKDLSSLFKDNPQLRGEIEQSISSGEIASIDASSLPVDHDHDLASSIPTPSSSETAVVSTPKFKK